jgi:hypothetical protein
MTTAIRIQCTCEICTDNATRLGKTVLAAEITTTGINRLAARNGELSKTAIHAIVHTANHPQLGRALTAHRSAYWAA